MRIGPASVLLLISAAHIVGQPTLLTASEALSNLSKQFEGGLPSCPDLNQLRKTAREDVRWLDGRFKGTKVDNQYVASLSDLGDVVRKSSRNADTRAACDALRLVAADLHTKRQDCRALGHSRTNIRVEIRTLEGEKEVAGWEVYALWLPRGDRFTAVPKRLQGLSSPARGTVPIPGEYELYAKQSSTGVSTDAVRVSIGGSEVFVWPLPVSVSRTSRSEK